MKPVHWCLDCGSALAEAEVEYEDKTSPAIDVAFRVVDDGRLRRRVEVSAGTLAGVPVDVVIWTTTPWTLPANQAVALRPEISLRAGRSSTSDGTARASSWPRTCWTRVVQRYGMMP